MVERAKIPGVIDEEDLSGPSTAAQKAHMALRFVGVLAATLPTTTVPPMAVTALFYRRFESETRYQRMHKLFGWADFTCRRTLQMDIRVKGSERLPADRSRLMFVTNHQSYVDIPMIMSALRIGAFLSKDLVAYIPVLGQIAWLGGTIYFKRKDPQSRRRALDDVLRMCEQSTAVAVFPEGTRSVDGNLREKVHLKAVESCFERGLRVSAFAHHGTRYVFPPTMDRYHGHQRVAVVVGDTFDPADFPDGGAMARAVWDEVGLRFDQAREMRTSPDWHLLPAWGEASEPAGDPHLHPVR